MPLRMLPALPQSPLTDCEGMSRFTVVQSEKTSEWRGAPMRTTFGRHMKASFDEFSNGEADSGSGDLGDESVFSGDRHRELTG